MRADFDTVCVNIHINDNDSHKWNREVHVTTIHGFELLREEWISERKLTAKLYRHQKTNARLLSLENDDENKAFTITFRTPPADSTGIAHILEHSVLCGSRKYPLKEPFIELVKGSLKTFLNAFTGKAETYYPVASQNRQDFYNLIDVYLDAVFHPSMTPQTLEQEGWHYELNDVAEPIVYKGVVFNEMKGAHGSPDRELYDRTSRALFPDNAYGFDSGGDPKAIPDLTWQQFETFHKTYYHPSNSYILLYGDDHSDDRLQLLDSFLSEFEPAEIESLVPYQTNFTDPKTLTSYYSAEDAESAKNMVGIGWLLTDNIDPKTLLTLELLEHILVGTPASPLRKALIESGLVEDIGGGTQNMRQQSFLVGLKGVAPENAEAAEALTLDTLATLARNGIDEATIEASLNTLEFALRENNSGSFPRGLALGFTSLNSWLYDGDPIKPLAFEAPLAAVKEAIQAGRYFEDLIQTYLVDNRHRVTLYLKPDGDLAAQDAAEEKARLDAVRETMSPSHLEALVAETEALKKAQETPDSEEALATLPMLTRADLDLENKLIPRTVIDHQGTRVLYHDLFTAGVLYVDIGMDLHRLPADLMPYIGLFGRALLEMGTDTEDYVQLMQRIGRHTGGIRKQSIVSSVRHHAQASSWLFLRGKAMLTQGHDLVAIMRDVLTHVKLDNQERFRQMALEEKVRMESGIASSGHRYSDLRLRSHFNEADWISEQMGGLSYLFFLRQLVEAIETDWPMVLSKLETIKSTLVNRDAMLGNVTCSATDWAEFEPHLQDFWLSFPHDGDSTVLWPRDSQPMSEGFTVPSQVNYVAKAFDLYKHGYKWGGSVSVITNYLDAVWLWEKVRVQGGAYGGFSKFDPWSGVFSYLSYRDPNLLGTLTTYDGTAKFLRELDLNETELTRSIIGTIGEMDGYQLPDSKGFTSLVRYLIGDTDEARQKRREEVLSTTLDDFHAFADILERASVDAPIAVVGSSEAIEAANTEIPGLLEVTKVL